MDSIIKKLQMEIQYFDTIKKLNQAVSSDKLEPACYLEDLATEGRLILTSMRKYPIPDRVSFEYANLEKLCNKAEMKIKAYEILSKLLEIIHN
jgi:hypothetical protein